VNHPFCLELIRIGEIRPIRPWPSGRQGPWASSLFLVNSKTTSAAFQKLANAELRFTNSWQKREKGLVQQYNS